MPKSDDKPLTIRCPNCKQIVEPDFDDLFKQYKCTICSSRVDIEVIVEKKKRGIK
jgi:DNA-directed RNA polymerase subunit RPC12/RpoP